jgi:GntR family transcriptional regulator
LTTANTDQYAHAMTTPLEARSRLDPQLPLWRRVANAIELEIEISAAPGSRLPSEEEQRARYGVSRVTLRQALRHLQEKGLLVPSAGRGWFVRDDRRDDGDGARSSLTSHPEPRQIFEPPGKLMSFSDMARSRGMEPDSVVIDSTTRPATFDEAEALRIAPGADVFLLRRLRRINGLAVALDRNLIPLHILPDALSRDFRTSSLHDAFRAVGAAPVVADAEFEAVVAEAGQAALLDVEVGFPLLKARQTFFDTGGRIIERGEIVYRGDRYRYRTRLVP